MLTKTQNKKKIGIIAGRGDLPKILIKKLLEEKREFQIFLLKSENYQEDYASFNPTEIEYGQVGYLIDFLKKNKIAELVFIGSVNKPNFSTLKLDRLGKILVAKILANKILGDDAVLKTVVKFCEKNGVKVIPINQLLDCMIDKKGYLGKNQSSKMDDENIAIGVKAIKVFSKFDIGQSLIVSQKQIIAVEATEGTDQMIKRCKDLEIEYKNQSILVKMKKRGQNTKVDLPTIGVNTIRNCINSGISGIAIEAKSAIILEKENVIKMIDEAGMFLKVL